MGQSKPYGATENYISEEEDMEIERQLKILNKPPVKTIVAKYGDIIDCIDMFNQPAFDHPLLKDHKIEVAPKLLQGEKITDIGSTRMSRTPWSDMELPREMCPLGTVPIRRTKKSEVLLGSKHFLAKTKTNQEEPKNYHHVSLQPSELKKYYGGYARIGIHNPTVLSDQFSTAQIWFQNGDSVTVNASIEIGWAVYPRLFGDNYTRLFSYWTDDGYESTGCFNTLCPGFVQVHRKITFGFPLGPLSVYGGNQSSLLFMIHRDPMTGHWWLSIEKEAIGYWPNVLFTNMRHYALDVKFGGVAGALHEGPSPPMGNGHFATGDDDFTNAGFMTEMKVFNETGDPVYFDLTRTGTEQDQSKNCYNLTYYFSEQQNYNYIEYGGPGGSHCISDSG